jgi:hypothetical protein
MGRQARRESYTLVRHFEPDEGSMLRALRIVLDLGGPADVEASALPADDKNRPTERGPYEFAGNGVGDRPLKAPWDGVHG